MLRLISGYACLLFCHTVIAQSGNQSGAIDESNPWYPHKDLPCLTTPQWVGEEDVEAVVVLAIDDMRDTAKYEQYLRPILNRLKQIDGRAPVSIMTCNVKPEDPQLQSWLEEGLSIDVHTIDHPCPLLNGGDFEKAKSTYDRCVDLLAKIPGNKPAAFRTPCCDSLNTVSPRFFSEIFNGVTPDGHSLQIDSSVFNFYTSEDDSIPKELILDEDGKERFRKYLPRNNSYKGLTHDNFVNYIENYPYPYVINNSCWQFPCVAPSDWSAQHLHGVDNPITIADWKAALDITVLKQGVFNLVFHPHGWVSAENVVDLIDHAVQKHGSKVKFLTFREAADRLNKSFTQGKALRDASDSFQEKLSFIEQRKEQGDRGSLATVPESLRHALTNGNLPGLPPLKRKDGTHNGFFVHGKYLCWQNEDTNELPDLTLRVSFDDARKKLKRVEAARSMAPIPIGAAVVDITPDYPVRLTGYGGRDTESEGAAVKIHARAMVIGGGQSMAPLNVLITVDNCGVPANVTEAVFAKLSLPRSRFSISSTHTHSGPWLRGFAPNVLIDLPEEHAAHLRQYESELIEKLVEVVAAAVAKQRPGFLSIARGNAGFAINRRTLNDGRWTGFGETPDGPVDHQMPILAAHDTDGKLIAVLANYACHATTETGSFNRISGDWPGFAADMIEADNPGAVALIAIGCGADANPSPRGTHEQAQQHGRTVADEVNRLLEGADKDKSAANASLLQRISPKIVCRMSHVDLPLGPLPTRVELEERAKQPAHSGALAKKFLKMLNDGNSVPTTVPDYPIQTWCFGEDLAMVFLGGEVVVDYSIRMNDMFDSDRLWINAYSNDVPCYIASKRILREGGYEADSSMVYYAHPTRLAPEAEDVICDAVQKLLPHHFYSDELQAAFPGPKSPEESLACISTRPDLRVELVAAEPLITDPVAFEWDVQGRLWVVEMGDYPSGAQTPRQAVAGEHGKENAPSDLGDQTLTGRVRVLEDVDGDGRYDKATTFLDGLNFPTGIHRWRGGVVVTAAPDLIYAEDTNGDLKADIRKVLYTGFVEGNQQHRVNGLRWSLDGWLHLANGDSGGKIESVSSLLTGSDKPTNRTIDIGGRDLRIQPDHGRIETLSGRTQFGRERDDFGNWFGNNNSNPIWHYVLEDHYLRRNPNVTGATTKAEVSETPGAAPVFPTSKTLSRFNDFDKANRFTSACSTSIYRDTLLGDEYYGNAFTCEPVHNLVSRLVLQRDGVTFKGARAEGELDSEVFASSDNWTRPVMVRTGPDGPIYIADMYRQVIEHPQWIPPEYQRKMNLSAGSNRGRIYRLLPDAGPGGRGRGEKQDVSQLNRRNGRTEDGTACCGQADRPEDKIDLTLRVTNPAAESPRHIPTRLSATNRNEPNDAFRSWLDDSWQNISDEEVTERLASPNGWWRDTAQRLLSHRTSHSLATVTNLATTHESPAVRVQALYTAIGHGLKPPEANTLVATALKDDHHEVRRTAMRLLEESLADDTAEPLQLLSALVNDPSPAVRHQLALSLGASDHTDAAQMLAQLLLNDAGSAHIVSAVMTSLNSENIGVVLQSVSEQKNANGDLVAALVGQAAAMKKTDVLRNPVESMLSTAAISESVTTSTWHSIASTMNSVAKYKDVAEPLHADADVAAAIKKLKRKALTAVNDSEETDRKRLAVLSFVSAAGLSNAEAQEHLLSLLTPASSIELQQAAVTAIGRSSRTALATLFDRWNGFTPAVRSSIVGQFLLSASRSEQLLDAVAAKKINPGDLDASARERLLNNRDGEVASRAKLLLKGTETSSARDTVVSEFRSQIAKLTSDAAAGKAVFEKRCSTCHKLQDIGKAIGADLAALKDRSTDALLTAILHPNKAVEAKFLSYTAISTDGLTYSGMLLKETGNSITLMGTDGKENVVPRADLEELVASSRSLMPEGLEKDLSAQHVADVIAFVQTAGARSKPFEGNEPRLIAVNDDGTLTLPASAAEIHGPSLIFENKYGNLGFWQSTEDYAVWNVDVPNGGFWTVEIDYACDSSTAGNVLKLSTGSRLLSARVPGTGTWDEYRTWKLGTIDLGRGKRQLTLTAPEKPTNALIDLRAIRLVPPR